MGYVGSEGGFFGQVMIGYYYKGRVRYQNGRNVIGEGGRQNNGNKDIRGVGKEFIMLNEDGVEMYRWIFMCEGGMNGVSMGERGIGRMGKGMSGQEVNEVMKCGVNRLILVVEGDGMKY